MIRKIKSYKKLYSGQKNFMFSPDGITLIPRASLEILKECPASVRDQIQWAMAKGWIQPVAHLPDDELAWEMLKS